VPRVSAALIVKNEEPFLPGCLQSLVGRVDEVVIVDTGSTDSSPRIAVSAGARLIRFDWTGDFSAARNHGLDHCSGDWILYIDADERLETWEDRRVADLIDAEAWIGALVRFRPKSGYTRYLEPRLFRRDSRLRFSGRIHETLHVAMARLAEQQGLIIGRAAVKINHLGYDGDQSRKHPRNLPLLRQSVRANPDRVYLWYHLAETLAALDRNAEAVDAAHEGLRRARNSSSEKSRADGSMIYQFLCRIELDQGGDPHDLLAEGLSAMPDDHALRFLRARREILRGDPSRAIPLIDDLLAIDPESLDEGFLAYDRRIFGSLARELKAAALLKTGRGQEAALILASLADAIHPH
jgi:glycosyltransferase involved in cell wall biosynthesis